jgi:hypothetical protein
MEPNGIPSSVLRADIAKLVAEIECLKANKTSVEYGRDGWEAGKEARRKGTDLRCAHAEDLIVKAIKANPGLSSGEVVKWVTDAKKWKESGLRPYGRSQVYQLIRRLVEAKTITPRPDPRRK